MSYANPEPTQPLTGVLTATPTPVVVISPRTAITRWLLARARESSTWRSIVYGGFGSWALAHPDQAASLVPLGLALGSALGVFLPDRVLGGASSRVTDPGQPAGPPVPELPPS
jgi:hypothetical protein